MAEILIPYRGNRNPQTIGLREVVTHPERGANCQTTTAVILDRLGYQVPHLRSLELLHDRSATVTVHTFTEVQPHDIILYQAKDGRTDPRYSHPAIAHVEGGTLFIAHNSDLNGRATLERARPEDQGRILVIKRPIARPGLPDVQFLARAGFHPLAIHP